MRRLSAAIDRPVTFAMLQADAYPDVWKDLLSISLKASDEGAQLFPQVAGRPTGLLTGHFSSLCLFDYMAPYQALKARNLDPDALVEALCDPEVRRSIVEWEPTSEALADMMTKAYDRTFLLGSPPNYEPGPEDSIAAIARRAGCTPLEVAYDAMLEEDGRGLLYVPILNYSDGDLEPVRQMLLHPRSALGLGDGGAHCGVICDASMPTFMLTHWTRDRSRGEKLDLEWVVRKQTLDTATLYGLGDRGSLETGKLGDVNLIDYEALTLGNPSVVNDLPGGGRRLVQDASGYVATIKSGTITFEDGKDTGARPGRLLRGAR
jgi:N-acyl-D-aspartate/D-glutamate deacylase